MHTHSLQTVQIHARMNAGYEKLHSARRAGRPTPDWMFQLLVMIPKPSVACGAILPHITSRPKRLFLVTDGSRLSDGRVQGALAICDSDTLQYTVYPNHCPIRLDHSCAIETYVAWITLRIRKTFGTQERDMVHQVRYIYKLTIIHLCFAVRFT